MTRTDLICTHLKELGWSYGYVEHGGSRGGVWIADGSKEIHRLAGRGATLEAALSDLLAKVHHIERAFYPDPDDDPPLTPEEVLELLDAGGSFVIGTRMDPMPPLPKPVSDWPGKTEEIERLKREGGEGD